MTRAEVAAWAQNYRDELVVVVAALLGAALIVWGAVDATGWRWLWKVAAGLLVLGVFVGYRYAFHVLWHGTYLGGVVARPEGMGGGDGGGPDGAGPHTE